MKKLLNILAQTALMSSVSLTVVACFNPLASGDDTPGKPPNPDNKDISYYQALILGLIDDILDCEKFLIEIESSNDYQDEKERQIDLDQTKAEEFDLKSQVAEAYYQILLIQAGDNYDQEQILTAIVLLKAKIDYLEQSLALKEKYPDDFDQTELQEIKDTIEQAKIYLEIFLKLKGD